MSYTINVCVGRKGLGYNAFFSSSAPSAELEALLKRAEARLGIEWESVHYSKYGLTAKQAEALRAVPEIASELVKPTYGDGWECEDWSHEDYWRAILIWQAAHEGVTLNLTKHRHREIRRALRDRRSSLVNKRWSARLPLHAS